MNAALRGCKLLLCSFVLTLALAVPAYADNYVALGDSYAAGTGSGGTTLNSSCLRTTNGYPNLIAAARPNTNLSFVACGGATTSTLMSSQISSVTASTNVVTVEIGGNDIGFANLILACTLGNCSSQLSSTANSVPATLPSKLQTVYSAIASRAPAAKVIVVGYPDPAGTKTCVKALGISSSEATGIHNVAGVLSNTIKNTAISYGFSYVDAIPAFTGHDVCATSPWLNGMTFSSSAYHPNKNGQTLGYKPIVQALFP